VVVFSIELTVLSYILLQYYPVTLLQVKVEFIGEGNRQIIRNVKVTVLDLS
jgi:hypothetical protein